MLRKAVDIFGFAVRETGQALDRLGCRLQGKLIFEEPVNRHRQIMNLYDKHPEIAVDVFVAPNASVIGSVKVGDKSSIWYNCVLRGDANEIQIGNNTTIQDKVVITTSTDSKGAVKIGDDVVIGRGALLRACSVGRGSVVGASAVVSDGCSLGESSVVLAGSVLAPATAIPDGEVWEGNPAVFVRKADEKDKQLAADSTEAANLATQSHKSALHPFESGYISLDTVASHAARQKLQQ